jgi:hypothetical protein
MTPKGRKLTWEIGRKGRAWRSGEALARYDLAPEKIEMVDGKLFNDDAERTTMLAMLLENLGVDAAVCIGSPDVWREAVARLR